MRSREEGKELSKGVGLVGGMKPNLDIRGGLRGVRGRREKS
jgi:hypothetical protein